MHPMTHVCESRYQSLSQVQHFSSCSSHFACRVHYWFSAWSICTRADPTWSALVIITQEEGLGVLLWSRHFSAPLQGASWTQGGTPRLHFTIRLQRTGVEAHGGQEEDGSVEGKRTLWMDRQQESGQERSTARTDSGPHYGSHRLPWTVPTN